MTLRRQLLLVSLLALMLPWAGCQFIRETESALRDSQKQMLASTARAIADSMAQYAEEFPIRSGPDSRIGDQLYGHPLDRAPVIDGYFEDWGMAPDLLRDLRGPDGPIRLIVGVHGTYAYVYVAVSDRQVVYADRETLMPGNDRRHADRVRLVSANPPYLEGSFSFAAEAPGFIVTYRQSAGVVSPEPTIRAFWQDTPGGYQLEARIPLDELGTHLGVVVDNTADAGSAGIRSSSFSRRSPGAFASVSPELARIAGSLVQSGMRLIVVDASGFRLAMSGDLRSGSNTGAPRRANWLRIAYDAMVDSGTEAEFAEPDPGGREQQAYVSSALAGRQSAAWFRSKDSGRAIVAVAEPVASGSEPIGAIVLQQNTDAILSLTNQGLARLMTVTLIAVLVVAASLLGYASWLSRRIRRLSVAAEAALDDERIRPMLPSSGSADEIGDLSRSFSSVLRKLGDYNEYLRTLASKLSHELRTPLAIVTSSLENLEHENLDPASADYTARARSGAERLRAILSAMSEASRVEELIESIEPERFDLGDVVRASVVAYGDVYAERRFAFSSTADGATVSGSAELLIQALDKLVDNAVGFSAQCDEIRIELGLDAGELRLDVTNPGPPLPERMHGQLFDSMVSMRPRKSDRHLGFGLYVAKLIVQGHGGRIDADNVAGGVCFSIWLPRR